MSTTVERPTAPATRRTGRTRSAAAPASPRTAPPPARPDSTTARPAPSRGTQPPAPRSVPRTAPPRRPAAKPAPAVKARRQAAAAAAAAAPRAPFVLLVVGLLSGALVSLLLLNTILAQDAFTLTELQRDNKQLTQRQQALEEEIARQDSPEVLASRARALGMVPATTPRFVHVQNGQAPGAGGGSTRGALATAGAAGVVGLPPGTIGVAGAPTTGAAATARTVPAPGRQVPPSDPATGRRPADQSAFGGAGGRR